MTQRFGPYLLSERIGSGGMGEIFRARLVREQGFEKELVIKRILPHLSRNPEFVALFNNEAKIAARLDHPNICQIFDFGQHDGIYYIAMEYIRGHDLRSLLDRAKRVPPAVAFQIASGCLRALDYAFTRRKVVHRDVSPQNIMLAYSGAVKLMDFGLAKAVHRESVASAGSIKGNFGYMSPEQVRGTELDVRSDLFNLGAVLYEMLGGRTLYDPTQPFTLLIDCIAHARYEPLAKLAPELDRRVVAAVERALCSDPAERYANAAAMRSALDEVAQLCGLELGSLSLASFLELTMGPAPPERRLTGTMNAVTEVGTPEALGRTGAEQGAAPTTDVAAAPAARVSPTLALKRPEGASGQPEAAAEPASADSPAPLGTAVAVSPPRAARDAVEHATAGPALEGARTAVAVSPPRPGLSLSDQRRDPSGHPASRLASWRVGLLVLVLGALLAVALFFWARETPVPLDTPPTGLSEDATFRDLQRLAAQPVPTPKPTPRPTPPKPTSRTGRLIVTVEPSTARVLVDGAALSGPPYTARLVAGPHKLSIEQSGYRTEAISITITADETLNVRQSLRKLPPKSVSCRIESTPAGARVRMAGRLAGGVTPLSLELLAGRRTLRLELDGYQALDAPLDVRDGQPCRLTLTLQPLRYELQLGPKTLRERAPKSGVLRWTQGGYTIQLSYRLTSRLLSIGVRTVPYATLVAGGFRRDTPVADYRIALPGRRRFSLVRRDRLPVRFGVSVHALTDRPGIVKPSPNGKGVKPSPNGPGVKPSPNGPGVKPSPNGKKEK